MRRISGRLALAAILFMAVHRPGLAAGMESCADWLAMSEPARQGFMVGFVTGQGYAAGYIASAL